MSETQSLQNPATYLINNGNYSTNKITFDLHLPKASGFTYDFSSGGCNISRNLGGSLGHVNAICFFMKKSSDNTTPLSTNATTRHSFNFNPANLKQHIGAALFDPAKDNTFVIVIHNDTFDAELEDLCFENLRDYIDNVRTDNSPKIIDVNFIPRKLGVSIITR